VFAPLALIADPAGFYYQQIGPDHGERLWVALGTVAIDAATDGLLGEEAGLFADSVELAVEGVTGVANAQAAATSHNFHRFSQEEFFSDLSFAAGTVVQAKALSTVGLQPISGYENHLLPWEEIPTSSQLAEIFRVGRGEQEEEGAEHEAERAHREPIERYHRALADLQGTRRKLPGFLAQNLRPDVPGPGPGSIQASETRYDPMASRFEPGERLPRRAPASGALSRRFVQIHAPTIEAPTAYDLLQRNAALHAESLLRNVH
jgi:hypothetical protein